jgi:hypothetical protein
MSTNCEGFQYVLGCWLEKGRTSLIKRLKVNQNNFSKVNNIVKENKITKYNAKCNKI